MAGRSKTFIRGSLTESVKGLFQPGTIFRNSGNSLMHRWAPLAYDKTFKDTRYVRLVEGFSGSGKRHIVGKSGWYSSQTFKASYGANGKVIVLGNGRDGLKIVALQLGIAAHYVYVAMEQWKVVLAQRALQIFKESFDSKSFNSAIGGRKWHGLMKSTIAKRKRDGTWPGQGGILTATGKLRDSLYIQPIEVGKNNKTQRITGEAVEDTWGGKRKPVQKRKRNYAGIHNNPQFFKATTYPNGTPYRQRKFMGQSTKIDSFIQMYESRYLFDSVFRVPK